MLKVLFEPALDDIYRRFIVTKNIFWITTPILRLLEVATFAKK